MRALSLCVVAVAGVLAAAPSAGAVGTYGQIVVAVSDGGSDQVRVVDPAGVTLSAAVSRPYDNTDNIFRYLHPSWSPDASRIAYQASSVGYKTGAGSLSLNVVPGGPILTGQLGGADPSGVSFDPQWSPVGDEIAYGAYTALGYVLRTIHPDGTGVRTVTGAGPLPYGLGTPAWSPDGKTIAFTSPGVVDTSGTISSVPSGGGAATLIAGLGANGDRAEGPAYSPDGKHIAYFREKSGQGAYVRIVVRDLTTNVETPVTTVSGNYAPRTLTWSPDGKRIAFAEDAPLCYYHVPTGEVGPSPTGCDLVTIAADGSDRHTILHADTSVAYPSWSPPGPVVTITKPTSGAVISGFEHVLDPEQNLQAEVTSAKALTGVCWAVQDAPDPIPPQVSCSNASGPTSGNFTLHEDLRAMLDDGRLKEGINTIRIWAYDVDGKQGSTSVTITVKRPNLVARWVEVAQAISPFLKPDPPQIDPANAGVNAVTRATSEPVIISGRETVARVYVDDAAASPDMPAKRRNITVRLTARSGGTVLGTVDTSAKISVGGPLDGSSYTGRQFNADGSINVVLPLSWVTPGRLDLEAEVDPGKDVAECPDCRPQGNRLAVQANVTRSSRLVIVPVKIKLSDGLPTDESRLKTWTDAAPLLPVGASSVAVQDWHGTGDGRQPLAPLIGPGGLALTGEAAASYVLQRLGEFQGIDAVLNGAALPTGTRRWVGYLPRGFPIDAISQVAGIAYQPGNVMLVWQGQGSVAAHELGHSVGLPHATSVFGQPAAGAQALPYEGIGGAGYKLDALSASPFVKVPSSAEDLMSYSPTKWTSPLTWQRMIDGLASASAASAGASTAHAARAAGGSSAARRGHLLVVGGLLTNKGITQFDAIPLDGTTPDTPAVKAPFAQLVARSSAGKVIQTQPLAPVAAEGRSLAGHASASKELTTPFNAVLENASSIASLTVVRGGRSIGRVSRSARALSAHFTGLPRSLKRTRARTIRWNATPSIRGLRYTLLARADNGRWQPLAISTNRGAGTIKPSTLKARHTLRLKLIASSGLNTTTTTSRAITVR